ncbi:lactonase family protein [Burkholderia stabilis]|uniref:6-phosphogluconolactonase,6-phosphogluconolacto nase,3-carboxymuconate cyclase,Lactonase, 7-bladed beta-propeller n=1 Tax=Burkholderia stabilis TaxID=95485 RepID=A0AAJ5T5C3_9BURK|nr:beta-propeller fold lactonase family protein [Burkholderia stabilis]VBB13307.1 6-phosphogluconolactonase,6-phosphogluconolacto nase,3-carboxymuconate cyclase,Lactonase, 7-bladed beta-propeller [Burkholderia stabilis]
MPNTDRLTVVVSNAADGDLATLSLAGDGTLAPLARYPAADVAMPIAVQPDRARLYVATRGEQPTIVAFRVAAATGALARIGATAIDASHAYLSLDRSGRWLLGASYGGNSLSLYDAARVRDGDGTPLQVTNGIANAHAVIVSPDNRFAYVSSLGSDRVFSFALVEDAGGLRALEHGETRVPAGFGPRHLRFARDSHALIVVSEFHGTLATFARDPDNGRLGEAHVSARHPAVAELAHGHARPPAPVEPSVWAADFHLTPDERFAYVSERTSSQLLCYRRTADGTFEPAHASATETQPRGFAIDPSGHWLVACGEQSEQVSVYAIAPDDGTLSLHARAPGGRGANWVALV